MERGRAETLKRPLANYIGIEKDLASQNDRYLFNKTLDAVYWIKLQYFFMLNWDFILNDRRNKITVKGEGSYRIVNKHFHCW